MNNGMTIKMFIPSGDPLKIIEVFGWTGKAMMASRNAYSLLKQRPELQRPGVYLLFGTENDDQEPMVYVGEADPLSRGILTKDTNCTSQDYLFASPSAAAAALLGRSANGRIESKSADGQTLKDLQNSR